MDFLGIGLPELLIILVLILIVVGPNRLPEMAAQLARFIRDVRRFAASVTRDFNETIQELEHEYEDVKGEWKEIGQGLDENARAVGDELQAADQAAKQALKEAQTAADEPSAPTAPPR